MEGYHTLTRPSIWRCYDFSTDFWFNVFNVLLSSLNGNHLLLSLGEGTDKSAEEASDWEGVGDGEAHQPRVNAACKVVLHDCDQPNPSHERYAHKLQSQVQPLAGSLTWELSLLTALQVDFILLLEPQDQNIAKLMVFSYTRWKLLKYKIYLFNLPAGFTCWDK